MSDAPAPPSGIRNPKFGVIDPAVPVRDLLAKYPHRSSALAAQGIDTCCGGVHPLEDAFAAKGLDFAEVLADLESAHAAAEAHWIVPPTTSVREVFRRFPATRPVLERHGLADCATVGSTVCVCV